jgi:site-specific DNA-cytosine methylase
MGNKRGTNEERGRVVDYAIDILRVKRPRAFILENVRGLINSNSGEDLKRLRNMIADAGYSFQHQLLKCEDFGIPQTRHRVFMVGMRDGYPPNFQYPKPLGKCPRLDDFLGVDIVKTMSNTVRCSGRKSGVDNAKNWSAYRLKDGSVIEYDVEQVTKLQGFPLDFNWGGAPESQKWKMLGNTIPTCLSRAMLESVMNHIMSCDEKPAKSLMLIPHPPPARIIIEKHLDECDKEAIDRKRSHNGGGKDDCDDVDETHIDGEDDVDDNGKMGDECAKIKNCKDHDATIHDDHEKKRKNGNHRKCERSSSDEEEKGARMKDEEEEEEGEGEEEEEEERKKEKEGAKEYHDSHPSPRKKSKRSTDPLPLPCITIKSGTALTLTLPNECDMKEFTYLLRIVK